MRGVPRWLAVLAVVAIVALVCAFTLHRALAPAAFWSSRRSRPPFLLTASLRRNSSSTPAPAAIFADCTSKWTTRIAPPWTRSRSRATPPSSRYAAACFPAKPSSDSPRPASSRSKSRCTPPSTCLTLWETARPTSCVCTIPPTALPFAAGSRCWRKLSITAITPRPPRSTTARRCSATPIARPCASMIPLGRSRSLCPPRLQPTMFASINIPTRRSAPDCFAFATAALCPTTSTTAHSPSSPTPRRSGGTTPTLWDATSAAPVPATCSSSVRPARHCRFTP